ncbi:Uma2 family endonuclease [Chlorogloea sp. CCALA 695]|uniref:Uma2 family endonuclease n=1 Tax=Chlorogloea sp. CCALA 695 TaxID=2107693 RepID=UPI000D0851AE|nr:Uma2 family endonuclease [Chlorogloea sp. CCALA 695]PSB34871.1 Uma2 family endonuclease [Chlorogloea sp. CCALA 695]
MVTQLLKRQFTTQDYHQMVVAGILSDDERVELIQGEIVKMSPVGIRHASCVKRLNRLFSQVLGDRAIVAVQDPVELSNLSEPQPDVALLKPRDDFYAAGHPQPQDILLLVEVADTTIESDLAVKIPLYASSGIIEVWLVDVNEQVVEIFREPTDNSYQNIQKFQQGEIFVQAFADVIIAVEQILG